MKKFLNPKLDTLPLEQRLIWKKLSQIPENFTLYGGTAIALQLGHRESVDFDFFGNTNFDPDDLKRSIPFLKKARIIERSKTGLTCLVESKNYIQNPVQISFLAVPEIKHIIEPLHIKDNQIKVAHLIDLSGMKVSVVQKRIEPKDYIDIDALISCGIPLIHALSAGICIYKDQFNPKITLKALSYFDSPELKSLPKDLIRRLKDEVKNIDLEKLLSKSDLIKKYKNIKNKEIEK